MYRLPRSQIASETFVVDKIVKRKVTFVDLLLIPFNDL